MVFQLELGFYMTLARPPRFFACVSTQTGAFGPKFPGHLRPHRHLSLFVVPPHFSVFKTLTFGSPTSLTPTRVKSVFFR